MHDELAERRRPLVAAPPVHHKQPADVPELRDGEVRGQGGLSALLERAQCLLETWRTPSRRLQKGLLELSLHGLKVQAVP